MTRRRRPTHVLYPSLDRKPPTVARAEGCYLYDEDGRRFLDGASGAVVANLGHGDPAVLAAMAEQAGKVSFAFRSQFTSEPAERLADELARLAPGDLAWTFFVNSGSEATELAQKIAVQTWQERGRPEKRRVLSRRVSYHGMTLGALSMSGHVGRRARFEPLLTRDDVVAAPYCFRCPLGLSFPSCDLACADTLESALADGAADTVAAFIAEPVVGASGGAITPPPGYYGRIREICDAHDVLFIADEVMTGLGRTGATFAMEHWGVAPDLMVLGKGLGAGYTPIGAVLVSERAIRSIRDGSGLMLYGHTMSGNPLSCAVALAVLRRIVDDGLAARAAVLGERLGEGLRALATRHAIVGDVRGLGLLWGVELVDADGGTFPSDLGVTARLVTAAFEDGLIVYPASGAVEGRGDAILVAPPLVADAAVIDELLERLDRALDALEVGLAASLAARAEPLAAPPGAAAEPLAAPPGPPGGPLAASHTAASHTAASLTAASHVAPPAGPSVTPELAAAKDGAVHGAPSRDGDPPPGSNAPERRSS